MHTLKFSNPNMSRTPMNRVSSVPGLVQELICWTNQVNVLEYRALAMACLFSRAYNMVTMVTAPNTATPHVIPPGTSKQCQ